MNVIPAIDLLDGQVVRLTKGDYSRKIVYDNNPFEQAVKFRDAGFDHIHVVDLNGAKTGEFRNQPHLLKIIRELKLSVQTGGGVRSFGDVQDLLDSGIDKVICSSMAVKSPNDWKKSLRHYPGRCILGMDLKDGKMAYGGWLETSDQPLREFLEPMMEAGLQEVLCTDISRDGTLEGPNFDLYRQLVNEFSDLEWIASGGVSSVNDLRQLPETGVQSVVVGKAYYEGKVSLEDLSAVY